MEKSNFNQQFVDAIIATYKESLKYVAPKRKCTRCQHEWIIRTEKDPRICPKCKSPYWNKERKIPKA